MKLFILLILFSGILIVVQGINNDIIKKTKEKVKVEYRFVPRSYFDDMLLNKQFSLVGENIFSQDDEWQDRNVSKKN